MVKAKSQRYKKETTSQDSKPESINGTTEKSETKKGTAGAMSSTRVYNFDLLEQQAKTVGIDE